jgi:4-amino-4-deoxy-L-arabinose transferase-like glycosyltransferase
LLVLLPWAWMRHRGRVAGPRGSALAWSLAPLAAITVIAMWLVPMVLASLDDPALAAYRNEILFGQTIDRYVEAEGHRKPFWYLLTNVIPWAWLPLSLALPWFVPQWRDAWRRGDARVILPLVWAVVVLLFFSLSSGKRGVYVFPALPAVVMAAAPGLRTVLERRWPNYLALASLAVFGVAAAYACTQFPAVIPERVGEADPSMIDRLQRAAAGVLLLAFLSAVAWRRRLPGLVRLSGFLAAVWLLVGWYVMPVLDDARSGAPVMEAARREIRPGSELGIVRHKESLILQARGPLTNFGHRRPDADQELADAARWLQADTARRLIVPGDAIEPCFSASEPLDLGFAHRQSWYLVGAAGVDGCCAESGDERAAIDYVAREELPRLFGNVRTSSSPR